MRIDPAVPPFVPETGAHVPAGTGAPPSPSAPETLVPSPSNSPTIDMPQISEREASVQWNDDQVMIVRLVNKRTGDLVEQVPSDEMLKVVHNLQQLLRRQAAASQSAEIK